jgi:hypothetical protein
MSRLGAHRGQPPLACTHRFENNVMSTGSITGPVEWQKFETCPMRKPYFQFTPSPRHAACLTFFSCTLAMDACFKGSATSISRGLSLIGSVLCSQSADLFFHQLIRFSVAETGDVPRSAQ